MYVNTDNNNTIKLSVQFLISLSTVKKTCPKNIDNATQSIVTIFFIHKHTHNYYLIQ